MSADVALDTTHTDGRYDGGTSLHLFVQIAKV